MAANRKTSTATTVVNAAPDAPPLAGSITVRAMRDSFRRAGFAFGREPVTLQLADLSPEQLALLQAEPMLVVEQLDQEA